MAFIVSLIAGFVLAFFLKGSLESPSRRGGWAVLTAVLLAVGLTHGWAAFYTLRVYWFALLLLFLMGAMDDLFVLRPLAKLTCQVVAGVFFLVLTPPGTWGGGLEMSLGAWAFPIWLGWLVGMTNAFNLLDNMDGLTPGVGSVAALGFVWLGQGAGWVLVPLAAALVGFLFHNATRARIHLGDAGSHLVGFSLAVLPLYGTGTSALWMVPLVLLIPIVDTSFVTVTRCLRGVSPFEGGKDHLSHRLVEKGLSPVLVLTIFVGVAVVLVLMAAVA